MKLWAKKLTMITLAALGAGALSGWGIPWQEPQKEPQRKADVVFWGDSLTARGSWQRLSESLVIENLGMDGETLAGLEERLYQVEALAPRALFLMVGINDLMEGTNHFLERYDGLLSQIEALLPETQVFVQSLLPVREGFWPVPRKERIEQVNRALEELTHRHGMGYLNLYPVLADQDGTLKTEFQLDGLHLTAKGYQAWEEFLIPILGELEVFQGEK